MLARNITGQYEGRTASARPGQAIMTGRPPLTKRRSRRWRYSRWRVSLAVRSPPRLRARAISDVPTDGPTDDPPFPRRRRPERHDGVHQRADSQRGVVTGYVALLSPAKRAATPASPGPAISRPRAGSPGRRRVDGYPIETRCLFDPTRKRRERPFFAPPFPNRAVRSGYRATRTESRDHFSRSALARLPTTQRRLSGTPGGLREFSGLGQRRELVSGHRGWCDGTLLQHKPPP